MSIKAQLSASLQDVSQPLGSISLDDAVSSARVRDHLANERTYLAWMRTAIALMGLSVVLAHFFTPNAIELNHGAPLSVIFAVLFGGLGLSTIVLSTHHYFVVRQSIDNQSYEPMRYKILVLSLISFLFGLGTLIFTLTLTP